MCANILDLVRNAEKNEITKDSFSESISEYFVTTLSDGTEVQLVPNGKTKPVTWENRLEVRIATIFHRDF